MKYHIIILCFYGYFGSHLDRRFETRAKLEWLMSNFRITHCSEYVGKVLCLYPDVHDFLHNPLNYNR